jgi:hypothetical protein
LNKRWRERQNNRHSPITACSSLQSSNCSKEQGQPLQFIPLHQRSKRGAGEGTY